MAEVKELKFAYWYVTHKILIEKIVLGIFIFANIIVWAFALTIFVRQFGVYRASNTAVMGSLPFDIVGYEQYHVNNEPQLPQVMSKQVIRTRDNEHDLVMRLNNQNANWLAKFDYVFVYQGGQTETQTAFLLPGEQRDILALGVESASRITQFDPDISNIQWMRTQSTQEEIQNRFNFSVIEDSINFTQEVVAPNKRVTTLTFQIRNNSAYSYWDVDLNVKLQRGTQPVAVNKVSVDQFLSEQTRTIEVNWFENLPQIASPQVVIEPIVNIFDESAYITPSRF